MKWRKVCFLIFVCSSVAFATDFTRFLSDGQFKIEDSGIAVDPAGAEYRYSTGGARELFPAVGASIFTEATGLPNVPVFPVLSGPDGSFQPATLRPLVQLARDADTKKLNGRQLGELTGHLLLNYILGGPADTKSIELVGHGEHFVNQDASHFFSGYDSEKPLKPADYLKLLPASAKDMWGSDRSEYSRVLEEFLARVEKMSPATIEAIFGPAFKALNRERVALGKPVLDYGAELKKRISVARHALTEFLTETKVQESVISNLSAPPRRGPPPLVHIPEIKIDVEKPPRLSLQTHPVEFLWGYYFSQNEGYKENAVAAIAEQLGVPKSEALNILSRLARRDSSRLFEVIPQLTLPDGPGYPIKEELPQTMLNYHNPDTLVVVPVNDDEAEEIARVAEKAGAHVLKVKKGHGSRMDEDLVREIEKTAARNEIERVIVVELPGVTPAVEEKVRKKGYELHIVDHHDYIDFKRHHPLSSLEQVARHLGWKLSPLSKAIAVMDRSVRYGLEDLGFSKEDVKKIASGRKSFSYVGGGGWSGGYHEKPFSLPTNKGPVYIERSYYGAGMKELLNRLADDAAPAIPNVLMMGSTKMRFSGSPEIVDRLTEIVRPYESRMSSRYDSHFTGGDRRRSMFWGLEVGSKEVMAEIQKKIVRYLESEANQPPPSGVEMNPRYPPSAIDPSFKPYFSMFGICVADVHDLLKRDSKDRARLLDSLRWDSLTEEDKKGLLDVSKALTEKEEMTALAKLVRSGYDSRFRAFLDKVDELYPRSWGWSGQSTTYYEQYRPPRTERPKVKPEDLGPPPESGLKDKLPQIRSELKAAAEGPRSQAAYRQVIEKYFPEVKCPWDFIELTRFAHGSVVGNKYLLERSVEQWIDDHFGEFLKLNPTVEQARWLIFQNIRYSFARNPLLGRSLPLAKTMAEYLSLLQDVHTHDGLPGTREKMLKDTIPQFLLLNPSERDIEQVAKLWGHSEPTKRYMGLLLDHATNADQFVTIARMTEKSGAPVFFGLGKEAVILKKLDKFLELKPTPHLKKYFVKVFHEQSARKAYLAKMLSEAESLPAYLDLLGVDLPMYEGRANPIIGKAVRATLSKLFSFQPDVDTLVRISPLLTDDARLEIARLALERAKTSAEIAKLAMLRFHMAQNKNRWKIAGLFLEHEKRFLTLSPSQHEKDEFNYATARRFEDKPLLPEMCVDWVRGLYRKFRK